MVRLRIGNKKLHFYKVSVDKNHKRAHFDVMGYKRRKKSYKTSRKGSTSYLPIVVLNNQVPAQQKSSTSGVQQQKKKKSSLWPGPVSIKDLTFGLIGSDSGQQPVKSGSSLLGSYSGGGCSGGSGGLGSTETLVFLAALAAAVWWLNMQITMAKRRKRRSSSSITSFDTVIDIFHTG